MDQSHAIPLLVAVFAILVLGVAAGSLNGATPADTHEFDSSGSSGESGSGGGDMNVGQSSSTDQTVSHVLFSDLTVDDGVDRRSSEANSSVGVFLLGAGLLLVGIVTVVFYLTGNDDRATIDTTPETEIPEHERSLPTITVTNAPLSNDVYRAWRTMVDSAGANAAEATPAELARSVRSAGLPAQPVDELTELFCAIRYGPSSPTRESEERARNTLERIRRAVRTDDSEALESDSDT